MLIIVFVLISLVIMNIVVYLTTPEGIPPYDATPIERWIEKHNEYWEIETDIIEIQNNYRWNIEVPDILKANGKPWYLAYKIEKWYKNKFINKGIPKLYGVKYRKIEGSDFGLESNRINLLLGMKYNNVKLLEYKEEKF